MGFMDRILGWLPGWRPPRPQPPPVRPPDEYVPPPPPAAPVPDPPPVPDAYAADLLRAHNDRRQAYRLPPLRLHGALTSAACKWAEQMARKRNLAHGDFASRIRAEGYRYTSAGENIAAGQADVAGVMASWMQSAGHKANILGDYEDVGFGVVPDAYGHLYWCADFAKTSTVREALREAPAPNLPPAVVECPIDR